MKKIQEIREQVAKKHGFNMWLDILGVFANSTQISYLQIIELENEVSAEYARQCCDEQKIECSKSLVGGMVYREYINDVKASILNTPNVVKTK